MKNQADSSTAVPQSPIRSWFTPHQMVLLVAWLGATVALIIMLLQGVRQTSRFGEIPHILHTGYVLALLWYLSCSGPSFSQLPELQSLTFPRRRFGPWIPAIGVALVLALVAFSDDGSDLQKLLMIVASIWVLVAWRKEIRLRAVLQGLVVAAVAFAAGFLWMKSGLRSPITLYGLLIFTIPMYVAGGLLAKRAGLNGAQLQENRYGPALRSILWGCLLFVPLGLANAAGGSPGFSLPWLNKWWMPVTLPWYSGITEETWFRLLLVPLVYLMLRPVFSERPAVAVAAAVLFSGITFGLGHARTMQRFLTTGLIYGVPLAAVFARRDWEHAVGAHYMINMIPLVTVFFDI